MALNYAQVWEPELLEILMQGTLTSPFVTVASFAEAWIEILKPPGIRPGPGCRFLRGSVD